MLEVQSKQTHILLEVHIDIELSETCHFIVEMVLILAETFPLICFSQCPLELSVHEHLALC